MSNETLSAEELGNKLLQSVKEMKVGNVARVSLVEPNEVAEARGKTGLTQREFADVRCRNGSRGDVNLPGRQRRSSRLLFAIRRLFGKTSSSGVNEVVNGMPTALRSVAAHYQRRYLFRW